MKTEIKKYIKNPIVILAAIGVIVGGYFLVRNFYPSANVEVYYLSNGDFSVFFPEQPIHSVVSQELTRGNMISLENYSVHVGKLNGSIAAGYIKSPFLNSNLTPEENLKNEVEYSENVNGSRLLSSNPTTFKGFPAIDYVAYGQLDKSLPPVYVVGRDILKGNDLYSLGYGYPSGQEDKNLENTFLESLVFGKASNSVDVTITVSTNFYIQADGTNVRECPSLSCKIVGTFSAGEGSALPYAGIKDLPTWVEVSWQDGAGNPTKGYINKMAFTDQYVAADGSSASSATQSSKVTTGDTSTNSNDLPSIIKRWSPSVALVVCTFTDGSAAFGSGYLVHPGTDPIEVVTNKHVITDVAGYAPTSCSVEIPGDGSNYYTVDGSTILVSGTGTDYAIIGTGNDFGVIPINTGSAYFNSVANKKLPVCQTQAPTGENLVILGYPDYAGQFEEPTATEGIISGYAAPYYTTSAQIEAGNSGGVAIDLRNDCYLGIPSAVKIGKYANLGRILSAGVIFN